MFVVASPPSPWLLPLSLSPLSRFNGGGGGSFCVNARTRAPAYRAPRRCGRLGTRALAAELPPSPQPQPPPSASDGEPGSASRTTAKHRRLAAAAVSAALGVPRLTLFALWCALLPGGVGRVPRQLEWCGACAPTPRLVAVVGAAMPRATRDDDAGSSSRIAAPRTVDAGRRDAHAHWQPRQAHRRHHHRFARGSWARRRRLRALVHQVWSIVNDVYVDGTFHGVDWAAERARLLARVDEALCVTCAAGDDARAARRTAAATAPTPAMGSAVMAEARVAAAIEESLARLRDPLTRFLPRAEYCHFRKNLDGETVHIGVGVERQRVHARDREHVALRAILRDDDDGGRDGGGGGGARGRARDASRPPARDDAARAPMNIIRVVSVSDDGPAANALRAGDVLLAVDGVALQDDVTLDEVVQRLGGRAGTRVRLEVARWERDATPRVYARRRVEVRRQRVTVPSVSAWMPELPSSSRSARRDRGDWRIVYLRIHDFSVTTASEVRRHLERAPRDATLYVIDLRGNAGGVFEAATDVARLLLNGTRHHHHHDGDDDDVGGGGGDLDDDMRDASAPRASRIPLVRYIGRDGVPHTEYYDDDGAPARAPLSTPPLLAPHAPMVVLMDGHTASSSEILAAALAASCRAVLAGPRTGTYGKASIQSLIELRDGSAISVSVARLEHAMTRAQQPCPRHDDTNDTEARNDAATTACAACAQSKRRAAAAAVAEAMTTTNRRAAKLRPTWPWRAGAREFDSAERVVAYWRGKRRKVADRLRACRHREARQRQQRRRHAASADREAVDTSRMHLVLLLF